MPKSLLYREGDIFETVQNLEQKTLLTHVCNDMGKWGAGFVIPLAQRYPSSRDAYLKWHQDGKYHLEGVADIPFLMGFSQHVPQGDNVVVANMVAQTLGGARPLRYDKLVPCMEQVGIYAKVNEIERIDCPLFGAGLAGGAWPFIHKLIQDCWLTRDIGVMVHYMPDKSPPGFMEWFAANYVGEVGGAVEVQP